MLFRVMITKNIKGLKKGRTYNVYYVDVNSYGTIVEDNKQKKAKDDHLKVRAGSDDDDDEDYIQEIDETEGEYVEITETQFLVANNKGKFIWVEMKDTKAVRDV